MNIYPDSYYNYLKNRKASYNAEKSKTKKRITEIYHEKNGVSGYRTIKILLDREGIHKSNNTIHKYRNIELGLYSIVRPKTPDYRRGKAHKVFDNLIKQDFTAPAINQKWVTDFTYLFISGGEVRYNCSILDLHDRSIVASITDRHITSDLAIRTLEKALNSQRVKPNNLILHSDQGSQYTSKAFVEYCDSQGITQSMSKAGYPYDNAPMERYFNTLKNEERYHYRYKTEQELYDAVENFAYVEYNHVRPWYSVKSPDTFFVPASCN